MNGTNGTALFADNSIFGIVMLLIIAGLFSGNGFGWGGNRGNVANDTLLGEEFIKRDIFNNQTAMLEGNNALTRDILENRFNCSQNACNTQKEIMQNRYDNALQTQTLSAQLNSCCCTLETAIHAEGEATRNMIQNDKIEQLRDQVFASNLALNNTNLANTVINAVRPFPSPSYVVSSPYTSLYNPYNGCGCGNTTII